MSDAPEEETPKAVKAARKRPARRVTKTAPVAAETVVQLSAPEPMVPPAPEKAAPQPEKVAPQAEKAAPQAEKAAPERVERVERPRPALPVFDDPDRGDSDHGDPVATMGEPPSSESQGGGSKKRRRRKKNKHGQGSQQGGGGGGGGQVFQTAPTQGFPGGYQSNEPRESREPREPRGESGQQQQPQEQPAAGHGPAPVMHAAQRPRLDAEEIARKAWKIFLAEVSEEGLALIGDNDARELSRRSFRLAEVFVEEAARRQQR